VKNFYLLDRNIISIIKESVAGVKQTRKDKLTALANLRKIDKKSSVVSPMLSIIEGQSGRKESSPEVKNTLLKETEAISLFFKNAKVDSKFLTDNSEQVCFALSQDIEEKWNDYDSFLKESNNFIFQPVSSKNKIAYEANIISLAKKHSINCGHLVVMICLSCLYGCDTAKKVLKPKKVKKSNYNSLSDIQLLSRVNRVNALIGKYNLKYRTKLLTIDKPLNELQKLIDVLSSDIKSCGTVFSRMSYSASMFPDLNESEYLSLMERTGAEL